MTAELLRSLAEIEASLRRLARPTLAFLQPGVKPEEVAAQLALRGLVAPGDLLELWAWRNGTGGPADTTLGALWLVPGFYLCSLAEATANFDAFVRQPRWNASWLPVLADGGGDFLAVACAPDGGHGAVYHFRIDGTGQPLEFRSIERMAATFAAALAEGAFYVDADGNFDEDYGAFAALAAELNPGVP